MPHMNKVLQRASGRLFFSHDDRRAGQTPVLDCGLKTCLPSKSLLNCLKKLAVHGKAEPSQEFSHIMLSAHGMSFKPSIQQ